MKRLLLFLLSLTLLVLLTITIFSSPTFAIRTVLVKGNRLVQTKEILQRVDFIRGANIFLTNESTVAGALKKNSIVLTVNLHRKLPTTVLVEVIERKPHFILNTGSELYEVDRFGLPYRAINSADPKISMVICKLSGKVIPGKKVSTPSFNTVRKCLIMAEARKIFGTVKVTVDPTGYLCLNVQDGYQVKVGQPDQLAEKLDVAKRVVEQVSEFRQRGLYVDVTCPREPAYRLKDE